MPDTPLLACPFCGVKNARIDKPWRTDWYYVRCLACGGQTCTYVTADEAAAAWNRRTPAQQPDTAEGKITP